MRTAIIVRRSSIRLYSRPHMRQGRSASNASAYRD